MTGFIASLLFFVAGLIFGVGAMLNNIKKKIKEGYAPELIGEDDTLNWKKEAGK